VEEFKQLKNVIECLLAPNGCPWDREQTLKSMRSSLLEETSEVIEAINLDDNQKTEEELGDLFFNVVFMCDLAEKEGRFDLKDVLQSITAKLIRRHPHIFGNTQIETSEQVLKQWEEIKKTEHTHSSLLDNVPQNLPTLARAIKIYKKIKKTAFKISGQTDTEMAFGANLFEMALQAHNQGVDAEQALRAFLNHLEVQFRLWEKEHTSF
jgi:MazG family protein